MSELNNSDIVSRNKRILREFISNNKTHQNITKRRLACGIGVNDLLYVTNPLINGERKQCVFYSTWRAMIDRCYSRSPQKRHPSYKDCTVCDKWTIFSNFKKWMEKQNYLGKQLDKDILKVGNKIYSPDTCVFVSSQVNSLLVDSYSSRGDCPQGVYLCKSSGRYVSQIRIDGKSSVLGRYRSIFNAEWAYVKEKSAYITKVALEQKDPRVIRGLIMHANFMRTNFECKEVMMGEMLWL